MHKFWILLEEMSFKQEKICISYKVFTTFNSPFCVWSFETKGVNSVFHDKMKKCYKMTLSSLSVG